MLLLYALTLLSSAFSLGGISFLMIRYRTRVVFLFLLFLLSLFLIVAGYAFQVFMVAFTGGDRELLYSLRGLLHLVGSGVNISILPAFIGSVLMIRIPRGALAVHFFWTAIYIVLGILTFLFPRGGAFFTPLTIMQVLSIGVYLVIPLVNLSRVRNTRWFKPIVGFLLINFVFLALLALDIAVTWWDIQFLGFMNNLSLPLYVISLNVAIFLFSAKFLSRSAIIKEDKLTDKGREILKLTIREGEIIEEVIRGSTNKEIGEKLFISVKTVENHLYNIYKKLNVGSRTQMIQSLKNWQAL